MRSTRLSPAAREDLIEIWLHIATDNERAADGLIDRLHAICEWLANTPGAGRHRPELGSLIRSFTLGSYVIFYEPDPAGVHVLRILHGARDVPPLP